MILAMVLMLRRTAEEERTEQRSRSREQLWLADDNRKLISGALNWVL
jgi:hypothetical protein